jgi:MFS transporter, AAHS family, 3-hydroxyphenylpropionic acid transporter
VLLLWACGILAGMQFAKVSVAFEPLQQLYGVSPAQMGWALSAVGMVGLVLGVTVGLVAPAIGYRRLLLGGLGLGAVLSAAQAGLPPFALLLVSRVLEGASHLAVVVAAPILIVASAAPAHRSIAMGLWSTFVGVAFAITAAIGKPLMAGLGLGACLLVHAAGMALVCALAWHALRRDPPETATAARPRLHTLGQQHVAVYTAFDTALPGLIFLCYTGVAVALLTFVPAWGGADRVWLAVLLPLMVIGGNFGAGWLVQRWLAPLQLVWVSFGAVAVSALAMGWCHGAGASIAPAALALLFTAGLAGGSAFALIPDLCREPQEQARANGAVAQMGNLGSSFGPPLMAALMPPWGMTGVVMPTLVFAVAGILLASWAATHLRGRKR